MSAPLRIAVPLHSFEPGGVERVALNLAAAWQADGAEVKVLLGRKAGTATSPGWTAARTTDCGCKA